VLGSMGQVLPVTETPITLCAELASGKLIRGECDITNAGQKIRRLWLDPENPRPSKGVLQALSCADAIVLGPGSLYTSIIPNLLVGGVAETVRNSPALKIFVCNLMTQPGETDGFTAADHLRTVQTYLGAKAIDLCIVNCNTIDERLETNYLKSNAAPVQWDHDEIARMGVVPLLADVLSDEHAKIRHDPLKLARLVVSLTRGIQRARDILSWRESLAA